MSDFVSLGFYKSVGHGAAKENLVSCPEQTFNQHDFVRDLGPSQDSDVGVFGMRHCLRKSADLFRHQQAGHR